VPLGLGDDCDDGGREIGVPERDGGTDTHADAADSDSPG
jgi:hypothetical protein